MGDSYKETLMKFKETLHEDIVADTNELLELVSPVSQSTLETAKSKFVFFNCKDDSCERLFNLLNGDIVKNKSAILNECNMMYLRGENPITMLLYMYRTKSDDIDKRELRFTINEVVESNSVENDNAEAISHILINWNWEECLELALDLIQVGNIEGVAHLVFDIGKRDKNIRMKAFLTIVSMKSAEYTAYYNDIVKILLSVQPQDMSKEYISNTTTILSRLTVDEYGVSILYNYYKNARMPSRLRAMCVNAMVKNITDSILNDIRVTISSLNTPSSVKNVLVELVGRLHDVSKKYKGIPNNLQQLYDWLIKDRGEKSVYLQAEDKDKYKTIVSDKSINKQERISAITQIARLGSSEDIEFIKQFEDEDDEMKIICASAMAQLGDRQGIVTIFRYLQSNDRKVIGAIRSQLKRLILLKNDKYRLSEAVYQVASQLLSVDNDATISVVVEIIRVYKPIVPTKEIAELFVNKFKVTRQRDVLLELLDYLKIYIKDMNKDLVNDIKQRAIELSQSSTIKNEAMKFLNDIESDATLLPN